MIPASSIYAPTARPAEMRSVSHRAHRSDRSRRIDREPRTERRCLPISATSPQNQPEEHST